MNTNNRLEQTLRLWEDKCFVWGTNARFAKAMNKHVSYSALEEMLMNAQHFRQYLLEGDNSDWSIMDFMAWSINETTLGNSWFDKLQMKFDKLNMTLRSKNASIVAAQREALGDESFKLQEQAIKLLGVLYPLPLKLAAWTRDSRRIFHLSSGMQALLNATSLRGMRWSDVRWPFPSFAVTLDEPILNHQGQRFDCILITAPLGEDNQAVPVIRNIHLIPDSLESRIPISQFERREIAEHLRKGHLEKVERRLKKAAKTLDGHTFSGCEAIEDRMRDAFISEFTEKLMRGSFADETCKCGKPHPEWNAAIHLVVGMCLYLSSIPAGASEQPVWRKAASKKNDHLHAITLESEVCIVTCAHGLTDDERTLFSHDMRERPESEMSPHFRRGHFRRPPGKGNDPTATKTVWVRPTLVNRDALRPGELVLGSETKL